MARYGALYLAISLARCGRTNETRVVSTVIGRTSERGVLLAALGSSDPELVAIYGRRRVGKTFLVREVLGEALLFELTGMHRARLVDQLRAFAHALTALARSPVPLAPPTDWLSAFQQLIDVLDERMRARRRKKVALFFDELPWLAARKSGFLPAFEQFWNTWASRRKDLTVVLCGSAASFMIREIVRQRGGLHHRVTRRIRLEPFTLQESEAYLRARHAPYDRHQILELYMALGGIPHYLAQVDPSASVATNVDRLCFAKDGLLHGELANLYRALFEKAERHEAVVRALARTRRGMTRQELAAATSLGSGGALTRVLDELAESGFVRTQPHVGHVRRDALVRLVDPYTHFYFAWIERHRGRAEGTWLRQRLTPSWRAWSGFAFESACIEHVRGIERALGIAGIETVAAAWQHRPAAGRTDDRGAQVDLVIERADRTITLCEMKFSEGEIAVDRSLATELERKRDTFRRVTRTRKTLLPTLVTTYGARSNAHVERLGLSVVTMDALFEP